MVTKKNRLCLPDKAYSQHKHKIKHDKTTMRHIRRVHQVHTHTNITYSHTRYVADTR